jgi:hypothetical protein
MAGTSPKLSTIGRSTSSPASTHVWNLPEWDERDLGNVSFGVRGRQPGIVFEVGGEV